MTEVLIKIGIPFICVLYFLDAQFNDGAALESHIRLILSFIG